MTTLLKVLLRQRHLQGHGTFRREYDKIAAKIDRELIGSAPSKAQFYRWLSGELSGLPYAHHCRVLEGMFPDWTATQLFEAYNDGIDYVPQPTVRTHATAAAPSTTASARDVVGHEPDLSGPWWASWQTSKDGAEVITTQEVHLKQQGDLIDVQTTTRGIAIEDGGYHWRGEMRLRDNEILMGWYAASDGSVRSKGTIYFVLHPHGMTMKGRWVGMSYDGKIMTGWGAMGRNDEEVRDLIEQLKENNE